MSRSGYSDDCDNVALWRQAVQRATTGYRGQHLLKKLLAALDAMPVKRLIADAIKDESGEVCAFGALDPNAPHYYAEELGEHFNVARALAAEVVYQNDEYVRNRPWMKVGDEWVKRPEETPEERWTRMRAWVAAQILPEPSEDMITKGTDR